MNHAVYLTLAAVLVICAQAPLFAQAGRGGESPQGGGVSVPFIGCVSYGQTDRLEAPEGTSQTVPISFEEARALAYYRSADGIAVLAPRGWECEGVSGSGGYALFVAPKPIAPVMNRMTPGWKGFEGPAIEIDHMTCENSGRWDIAKLMTRVFPAYRAFARRELEGMDLPVPSGPYPKDVLTYKSQRVVEYTTPPHTDGLGTQSWLTKNNSPIAGAAIVIGDPPDLILLQVRLPAAFARLTPAIVRQAVAEPEPRHP